MWHTTREEVAKAKAVQGPAHWAQLSPGDQRMMKPSPRFLLSKLCFQAVAKETKPVEKRARRWGQSPPMLK